MSEMRIKSLNFLPACLSAAALLVGCSDEGGTPTPTGPATSQPTESSQQGGSLPHSGAPKVTSPVSDTSSWEADPCSAITEEQFSSAGLEIGRFEPDMESDAGPGCEWALESGFAAAFSGTFITFNKEGLSALYKANEGGSYQAWDVLEPVEGFPAVRASEKDEESDGVCAVATGIRDNLIYSVVVTLDPESPEGKDPCKAAQDIAALAVQTMKGGA